MESSSPAEIPIQATSTRIAVAADTPKNRFMEDEFTTKTNPLHAKACGTIFTRSSLLLGRSIQRRKSPASVLAPAYSQKSKRSLDDPTNAVLRCESEFPSSC